MFEFGNSATRLTLYLIIGPGHVEIRQKIVWIWPADHRPLKPVFSELRKSYNTIYKFHFLSAKSYQDASTEDLEAEIQKKWAQFLEYELPPIRDIIAKQTWIFA